MFMECWERVFFGFWEFSWDLIVEFSFLVVGALWSFSLSIFVDWVSGKMLFTSCYFEHMFVI